MTIGEVAKLLDITPTSTRNYVHALGSNFLSPGALKPNGKRFTPEDVSTLRKFRLLLTEGYSYHDAIERLPVTPEIVAEPDRTEPETEEKQNSSAIQTIEMFERFQELMKLQQEQFQETVHAKDETISILQEENERLRLENDRLKLPWWKKLFT